MFLAIPPPKCCSFRTSVAELRHCNTLFVQSISELVKCSEGSLLVVTNSVQARHVQLVPTPKSVQYKIVVAYFCGHLVPIVKRFGCGYLDTKGGVFRKVKDLL